MASHVDWARKVCLSLPHATEDVQWEHDLLFRIAGKMFCVANMEPQLVPTRLAFKCTPEKFAELVEIEGIIPAPYMARNHWVAILKMDALRGAELQELVRTSYRLVREKLPKKTLAQLEKKAPAAKPGSADSSVVARAAGARKPKRAPVGKRKR